MAAEGSGGGGGGGIMLTHQQRSGSEREREVERESCVTVRESCVWCVRARAKLAHA